MRISRKTRHEIQSQSVKSLAKYKDSAGHRLSHQAIGAEIQRRVATHLKTHPVIRKHAAKKASRVLK